MSVALSSGSHVGYYASDFIVIKKLTRLKNNAGLMLLYNE